MIKGIEVDPPKVDWYVKNSLMLGDRAGAESGILTRPLKLHTLRTWSTAVCAARPALKLGYLTARSLMSVVMKPERMTRP